MISEKLQRKYDSGLRGQNLIAYEGQCRRCGVVNQVFFAFARDPEVIQEMLADQYAYKFCDTEDVLGVTPFTEKLRDCQSCVPHRGIFQTVKYKRLPLVYANYLLSRKISDPMNINFDLAQEQLNSDIKMDKALAENDQKVSEAIQKTAKNQKVFTISS